MIIEHFPVKPLGCNCIILGDPATKQAIVVDPGGEAEKILGRLDAHELTCVGIVHTHTHFDHVGATGEIQQATGAPTMLHEADMFMYEKGGLQMQLDTFGMPIKAPDSVTIDRFLEDDDSVSAGAMEAGVVHTPGHTPGSLCFSIASLDTPVLLTGDTLFQGSIGRTDLWKGDHDTLIRSVRTKLLSLPENTLVIPGHGPTTTIEFEKRANPFLR